MDQCRIFDALGQLPENPDKSGWTDCLKNVAEADYCNLVCTSRRQANVGCTTFANKVGASPPKMPRRDGTPCDPGNASFVCMQGICELDGRRGLCDSARACCDQYGNLRLKNEPCRIVQDWVVDASMGCRKENDVCSGDNVDRCLPDTAVPGSACGCDGGGKNCAGKCGDNRGYGTCMDSNGMALGGINGTVNPCAAALCPADTSCVVVTGQANCLKLSRSIQI